MSYNISTPDQYMPILIFPWDEEFSPAVCSVKTTKEDYCPNIGLFSQYTKKGIFVTRCFHKGFGDIYIPELFTHVL